MTGFDDARTALLISGLRTADDAALAAINYDLGPEPGDYAAAKIRVICPRGHFVADVAVVVADTWPGIALWPRIEHGIEPAQGLRYEERQNWSDLNELLVYRVRASRDQAKCNYQGSHNKDRLAVDLAEAAAAGHAVYRLKS